MDAHLTTTHPSHTRIEVPVDGLDVGVGITRVQLSNGETQDLYSTAGPGSDPRVGLPPLRAAWIAERSDMPRTQLALARNGVITPEDVGQASRGGDVAAQRIIDAGLPASFAQRLIHGR